MNSRATPPATAKGRRAWLFLSVLMPALASKVNTQNPSLPPPPEHGSSRPYLQVIGPPPLRFEDVLPPPDLSVRPPAGAPPRPNPPATVDVVPARTAAAPAATKSVPTVTAGPASPASAPLTPAPAPVSAPASASAGNGTSGNGSPAPILPDDVPASVRPDDFLPYFQYPGATQQPEPRYGRGREQPPAPQPTSTATYNQE